MIYLDNAATTYPKPERVYSEMDRCHREYCANPGRGGHVLSIRSGQAVANARDELCRLFNISNTMQLSFTKNATEALNILIKGYLAEGDNVITTAMEHNSVMRPLKILEREIGIEISILKSNAYGEIDIEDLERSIKSNTRLIISTLSSNVNGIIMPVKEIGAAARRHGVAFLLDASQGAGSIGVDVEEMCIDMLAFPGHKGLMGPCGTGGLYVRDGIRIAALIHGGTGSNSESFYQPDYMPDMLESGTLNTPGIVGLCQGARYIRDIGIDNIRMHKHQLIKRLHEGVEDIKQVILYSRNDIYKNSGIVALNFKGVAAAEVSYVLDKAYGICTRAGMHCSPSAHRTMNTWETGTVRFSVGCFNTMEEVDSTIKALRDIASTIKY